MASRLERFGYPDFTGRTILVVDDHQDTLDFMSELLGFCGATVATAWSTAHARTWLDSRLPSLIVCDFQLPRESGVDFIRWLRLLSDERGTIPAVAVTAYPEDFLRQHDDALAFDAYFVKPIEAPRFLRTVETILSRPPTPRRLRSA
jgi:two-component system OmpR family response regulator